jgi:hypothetical protein
VDAHAQAIKDGSTEEEATKIVERLKLLVSPAKVPKGPQAFIDLPPQIKMMLIAAKKKGGLDKVTFNAG